MLTTELPFKSSIFRYEPTAPLVAQEMVWVDPAAHDSSPLGEERVTLGGGGPVMVKRSSLVSERELLDVLVILILYVPAAWLEGMAHEYEPLPLLPFET